MRKNSGVALWFFSALCATTAVSCSSESGKNFSVLRTMGEDSTGEEGEFYVSFLPKGKISRFVTRWATPQGQLVVTRSPVPEADWFRLVTPPTGKSLYLVELHSANDAVLTGEIFRRGQYAVVSVPVGLDPHGVIGRHDIFAERLYGPEKDHVTGDSGIEPEIFSGLGQPIDLPQVVIDREFLVQKLKEFSGEVAFAIGDKTYKITERRSAEGRALARAWLKQEYQNLGYITSEHVYGNRFAGGVNFVADRPGAPGEKKFIILSAHLDSVGNAGADDDGAGIVSALAIAKALRPLSIQKGLRVVAFDQEENGLVGSSAYARFLSDNRSIGDMSGNVTLEMTGYDSDDDGGFHAIDCDENSSSDLTAAVTGIIREDSAALERVEACTNRSDHASFWRYNRPAIVLSENFFGGDGNPCYHKACDRMDRINTTYMTKMTRLSALTVASFLQQK